MKPSERDRDVIRDAAAFWALEKRLVVPLQDDEDEDQYEQQWQALREKLIAFFRHHDLHDDDCGHGDFMVIEGHSIHRHHSVGVTSKKLWGADLVIVCEDWIEQAPPGYSLHVNSDLDDEEIFELLFTKEMSLMHCDNAEFAAFFGFG